MQARERERERQYWLTVEVYPRSQTMAFFQCIWRALGPRERIFPDRGAGWEVGGGGGGRGGGELAASAPVYTAQLHSGEQ